MTQHKETPSNAELIRQTLNTKGCQNNDLFAQDTNMPIFWKLSDLAILYPNFFDVREPISQLVINKLHSTIRHAIPEFTTLTPRPVHILTTKDTYNIYIKQRNQIKTLRNAPNQYLTGVACEYLFGQHSGTELEQACFLYPNKNSVELTAAAQELKFENRRNQIARTSNLISAIINRAKDSNKNSFRDIWSTIWQTLYNVKSMETLRLKYNVKTSPIDYMKSQTLRFIDAMLQEIALQFTNKSEYSINEVRYIAKEKAKFARAEFFRYGSSPELQLLKKNSYHIIEKIRNARKKFWQENYPQSLR